MLPLVSIFKAGALIREFHLLAACFRLTAVLAFAKSREITQIKFIVRASAMCSDLLRARQSVYGR